MKVVKKSEFGIKTFLLIGVPLLSLWIYNEMQEHKAKEKYLNSLNLQLQGIVHYVYAPNSSNGFGIIGVDVLQTNRAIVDTSVLTKYCIVKNNKAEFYQLGAKDCNLGDTIEADTDKRTFIIKRQMVKRELKMW